MANVRAAILAAGRGVRMGGTEPKTLLPIGEHEPLLYYLLKGLKQAGVDDLLVVTGFQPGRVQEYVAEHWGEATYVFNARYASWGNFHSVRLALEQSPGSDLLLVNSDIVVHPEVFTRTMSKRGDLVLAVQQRYSLDEEDMRVRLERDRVLAIGKDVPIRLSQGEFAGVSLFARRGCACTRTSPRRSSGTLAPIATTRTCTATCSIASTCVASEVKEGEYAEVDTPDDVPRGVRGDRGPSRAHGARRRLNRPSHRGVPSGLHLREIPTTKSTRLKSWHHRSRSWASSDAVRPGLRSWESAWTKAIGPAGSSERVVPGADQRWAADMGSRAHRAGADAIVAVGGGRTASTWRSSPRHGPGCSDRRVPPSSPTTGSARRSRSCRTGPGRTESLGAIAPRAVFISIPTLVGAPLRSVAAGIGDLLANPLALKRLGPGSQSMVSTRSTSERGTCRSRRFESIGADLDRRSDQTGGGSGVPAPARRRARALGMAMIIAGTSRPASGGEHEISHALEELLGGRAMHGAQVAFGCIVSLALYGEDPTPFRRAARTLGASTRARRTWG